jgi:hypothetical protein
VAADEGVLHPLKKKSTGSKNSAKKLKIFTKTFCVSKNFRNFFKNLGSFFFLFIYFFFLHPCSTPSLKSF